MPDAPEYGLGGKAYARARALKEHEDKAQAWHDQNVTPAEADLKNAREVLSAYDQLVDDLRAENARLREALGDFVAWSEAYPTDVFPPPDLARANELLHAGGMTLDLISASIMRHTMERVGARARAVLEGLPS